MTTKPWMMLVAMLAGWINRQQQEALAVYFNRVRRKNSKVGKELSTDFIKGVML